LNNKIFYSLTYSRKIQTHKRFKKLSHIKQRAHGNFSAGFEFLFGVDNKVAPSHDFLDNEITFGEFVGEHKHFSMENNMIM
jgi:hypothetical protein